MARPPLLVVLASLISLSAESLASSISEAVRLSERRDCLIGPHELGRIRALPGQGVPVRPPKNPFEDALPHCAPVATPAPALGRAHGGRR